MWARSTLAHRCCWGRRCPRAGGQGEYLRRLLESVKRLTGGGHQRWHCPCFLCPSPARYHVRRWLEPFVPKITVLAPVEIPPEIRVRSVGTVGLRGSEFQLYWGDCDGKRFAAGIAGSLDEDAMLMDGNAGRGAG